MPFLEQLDVSIGMVFVMNEQLVDLVLNPMQR